jgi:hypothetical protein
MRTIKITIPLFLLPFIFIKAQVDTTDWFPMQTGNYWEYMAWTIIGPNYFSQKVVGDTLMLNGKTYKILSEEYFNPYSQDEWYVRKESEKVFRYYGDLSQCSEREYEYLNFSAPDLSIWQICRISNGNARGIKETFYDYTHYNFLNKPNKAKQFEDVEITSTDTIWTPFASPGPIVLNKGLGIVWHLRFSDGSYYLQGAIINGITMGVITNLYNEHPTTPLNFYIKAYPNPFNSTVNFKINLPESDISELSLYNVLGQKVVILIDQYKKAGEYNILFNADQFSSGVYLAVLRQNNLIIKEKIILIK